MLSAFAAGPIRIGPNIVGLDVDLDRVVDLRRNKHRRKRRVPPLRLVERRNPHQPMDAGLAAQQPESIIAGDGEGRRLDAGFFAVLIVVHLGLKALLFGPAQIHAQQHLGPVLRFRPASARMNRHDSVQRIGFARQHGPEFKLVDVVAQARDLVLEIGLDRFALTGQLEVGFDVARAPLQIGIVGELAFDPLPVAHDRLRQRRVRPQRRIGQPGFDGS